MEIKILLIIDFIIVLLIGIFHFLIKPKTISNFFWGYFTLFFAFNILHIINVNVFFQTRFNPLILIPLNLLLIPAYFLLRYLNSFFSFEIFNKKFLRIVLIGGLIELVANLLPLGAWIYTNQFDLQMIKFVFTIKRLFIALLIPLSITVFWILYKSLKTFKISTSDDKLKKKWGYEISFLLIALIAVILLPEIAYVLNFRSFSLVMLQATFGAAILTYIGLRNINIQIKSAIITAENTITNKNEMNNHLIDIVALFENEKIYREQDLRIIDIANKISLSPNYISKIINENAQKSFNDFVNEYRVNEVKQKLKQNEHQKKSIFALAQEAGFKSKSTFQSVFKKVTGNTPTAFIKKSDIQQN